MIESNYAYATRKCAAAVRLARDCTHNWLDTGDRRFLAIRTASMQDARHWQSVRKGRTA